MRIMGKDLLNKKYDKKRNLLDKMQTDYWFYETTILTMSFVKEFWELLKERKKYWLFPILFVLVIFGSLIILSQGTAIAPFIYTIF